MTTVLALLTALAPLSTDMYLPSLPAIARDLGATTSGTQLTLSIFLVGLVVGQFLYGPISDRFGRRPALIFGLCLFTLASAICAAASSIEVLVIARFVQALGASGPIVLGRAVVRDLYEGPRAGRELSRMGSILGLVPAIAPVLGGVLESAFGWRATFAAIILFGIALLAVVAPALPETLRARATTPLSFLAILRGYRELWADRAYRIPVLLAATGYAGLFAFISGSSFALQSFYGLDPFLYGLSFGFAVLGFIAGTLIAQRLVPRLGLEGVVGVGIWCFLVGGLAMVALVALRVPSSLAITGPMLIYAMGHGLVLPQSQALALMPFPDRAGAASSLLGICQMTGAASIGALVGAIVETSPLALPIVIAVLALIAFAILRLGRPGAPV
ncbi:MAG TPA: multidrug effflux MFS transporter [Beijerinckiaceae bacterium]